MNALLVIGLSMFHGGLLVSSMIYFYREKRLKAQWAEGPLMIVAILGSILVILWAILRACGVPQ